MTAKNEPFVKRKPLQRVILYSQDVVALTGRHEQTARKMLKTVREAFGKSATGLVTIREFSQVFEIDEELIQQFVK